ncbi:MAG TPA: hypothetical protein VNR91_02555, partial [Sphingomonas sp.]|nr:hypothetical protein [Sphingomonas sp.]
MAEDQMPAEQAAPAAADARPVWQRIALWGGAGLIGLIVLAAAIVLGLDTQVGRRFVADRIGGYTMANGINLRVGRIDGSLYGAMVLRDVKVQDQHGVFATSPQIAIDWRPFAYLRNHVDVRSLASPLVSVARLPELKPVPSDPNAPILPDLDIDVGRLTIKRIDLAPAVSGERRLLTLDGSAHVAHRRAQIVANAATIGGGDRLALNLDAVPDADRLGIDARISAPKGGLIATMAGLDAPLIATIAGKGSWKAWNGRAAATLGGGQLADLAIEARNGTFRVRGPTQPGLYLKGPVERLTAPRLDVALDTTLNERKADTRLQLRSSALAVAAQGMIDLGQSRFGNVRAEARLLTPGAIAPNLSGRSVRAAVALDGPFARPVIDYKIQAAALGFGEMGAEGVYVEGKARVDADRIMIPVAGRVARVTGLNAAAGGLLTNVRLNGDLAVSGGTQILSDNLRIRSDKIDATAIIAADMAKGRYTGALKGRVNDYRIDGVGIVNVTTDAKLYSAASGGFGIRGRVAAQTARIFNDGLREFLGGNAYSRADLDYTPQGIIAFSGVRVNAPAFRITAGSGRYDPAGPILVNAQGWSRQYGPLTARVNGTLAAPVVNLRAPRPGVGIGLVDLNATIRGQGTRYAVTATGGTDYGPFDANLLLATSPRIAADVRNTRFAGILFNGRVEQTVAGPFAGSLRFAGSGVNGTLGLGAEGKYQRADVDARANNAVIPGTAGLTIGRAIITGRAVMYPGQPAIVGDAQIAAFKMGNLAIKTARAKIDYHGGNGTAQAFAEGSSGVPFRIGANARFSPKLWLAALQGQANGINFRTVNPARIEPVGGEYRLSPTRIDFDQGSLRLAGRYGRGMALQSRLDKLDLAVVNAFVPNLGIGGTATGSIAVDQPS